MAKSSDSRKTAHSAATPKSSAVPFYTYRLLVVADLGPEADYSAEPRHFIKIRLPFRLDEGTGSAGLRSAIRQSFWTLQSEFNGKEGLLLWTLNDRNQPELFVTRQLLQLEKAHDWADWERIEQRIYSQVASPLPTHSVDLLVRAEADFAVSNANHEVLTRQDADDMQDKAMDQVFAGFLESSVLDEDFQKDANEWEVSGEGWIKTSESFQFDVSKEMTAQQIRRVINRLWVTIQPNQTEIAEIWLLVDGNPTISLNLLLDRIEAQMSEHEYYELQKEARKSYPLCCMSKRLAA